MSALDRETTQAPEHGACANGQKTPGLLGSIDAIRREVETISPAHWIFLDALITRARALEGEAAAQIYTRVEAKLAALRTRAAARSTDESPRLTRTRPQLAKPSPQRRAQRGHAALQRSVLQYAARRANHLAQDAHLRAQSAVPESCGPYHSAAVTARALEALAEHPALLRAWAARLSALPLPGASEAGPKP